MSGKICHNRYEIEGIFMWLINCHWCWKLRGHKKSLAGDNAVRNGATGSKVRLDLLCYMQVYYISVLLPKTLPQMMVWKCIVNGFCRSTYSVMASETFLSLYLI